MTRTTALAGIVFAFAGSAASFAADPVDVSALVTDRTVAVARIDLSQLKVRPAVDWAADTLTRAGATPDMLAGLRQGGAVANLAAQPAIDGLRRAGVDELAVVVQLADRPTDAPVLLLAVKKPANPAAVVQALSPLNMRSGEKAGLQVFSPNLPPGVLAKLAAADRPDLAVDRGPAALAIAVGLTDAAKADLLAAAPPAAGETLRTLVSDVKRYTLRVATTPSVDAAAEAVSPKAAAAVKELMTRPRPDAVGRTWAAVVGAAPPKLDGTTLSLAAGQAEIDAIARALVPAVDAARQAALRVQSASNLRQLALGLMMYANQHDDDVPPTLAATGPYHQTPDGKVPPKILVNPARPELGQAGYVYVPLKDKLSAIRNSSKRLAIYEAGDFGDGVYVAFWDGHIDRVTDKAKFEALLAEAKK